MDKYGGLPEWWQWPIPRHGNYGGVGWSAGRWLKPGDPTDWDVEPTDEMDALYRDHDREYRPDGSKLRGDLQLVPALHKLKLTKTRDRAYKTGAIITFSMHAGWLLMTGRGRV